MIRQNGALFLGIDHSAISVSDTSVSKAFYAQLLGMIESGHSLNKGPAQARLDGLDDPVVDVTALQPTGQATPHLELLGYHMPSRDEAQNVVRPDERHRQYAAGSRGRRHSIAGSAPHGSRNGLRLAGITEVIRRAGGCTHPRSGRTPFDVGRCDRGMNFGSPAKSNESRTTYGRSVLDQPPVAKPG